MNNSGVGTVLRVVIASILFIATVYAEADCETPYADPNQIRTYKNLPYVHSPDHPKALRNNYMMNLEGGVDLSYDKELPDKLLKIARFYMSDVVARDKVDPNENTDEVSQRFFSFAVKEAKNRGHRGPLYVAKSLRILDDFNYKTELRKTVMANFKDEYNGLAIYYLSKGNIKEFEKNVMLAKKNGRMQSYLCEELQQVGVTDLGCEQYDKTRTIAPKKYKK